MSSNEPPLYGNDPNPVTAEEPPLYEAHGGQAKEFLQSAGAGLVGHALAGVANTGIGAFNLAKSIANPQWGSTEAEEIAHEQSLGLPPRPGRRQPSAPSTAAIAIQNGADELAKGVEFAKKNAFQKWALTPAEYVTPEGAAGFAKAIDKHPIDLTLAALGNDAARGRIEKFIKEYKGDLAQTTDIGVGDNPWLAATKRGVDMAGDVLGFAFGPEGAIMGKAGELIAGSLQKAATKGAMRTAAEAGFSVGQPIATAAGEAAIQSGLELTAAHLLKDNPALRSKLAEWLALNGSKLGGHSAGFGVASAIKGDTEQLGGGDRMERFAMGTALGIPMTLLGSLATKLEDSLIGSGNKLGFTGEELKAWLTGPARARALGARVLAGSIEGLGMPLTSGDLEFYAPAVHAIANGKWNELGQWGLSAAVGGVAPMAAMRGVAPSQLPYLRRITRDQDREAFQQTLFHDTEALARYEEMAQQNATPKLPAPAERKALPYDPSRELPATPGATEPGAGPRRAADEKVIPMGQDQSRVPIPLGDGRKRLAAPETGPGLPYDPTRQTTPGAQPPQFDRSKTIPLSYDKSGEAILLPDGTKRLAAPEEAQGLSYDPSREFQATPGAQEPGFAGPRRAADEKTIQMGRDKSGEGIPLGDARGPERNAAFRNAIAGEQEPVVQAAAYLHDSGWELGPIRTRPETGAVRELRLPGVQEPIELARRIDGEHELTVPKPLFDRIFPENNAPAAGGKVKFEGEAAAALLRAIAIETHRANAAIRPMLERLGLDEHEPGVGIDPKNTLQAFRFGDWAHRRFNRDWKPSNRPAVPKPELNGDEHYEALAEKVGRVAKALRESALTGSGDGDAVLARKAIDAIDEAGRLLATGHLDDPAVKELAGFVGSPHFDMAAAGAHDLESVQRLAAEVGSLAGGGSNADSAAMALARGVAGGKPTTEIRPGDAESAPGSATSPSGKSIPGGGETGGQQIGQQVSALEPLKAAVAKPYVLASGEPNPAISHQERLADAKAFVEQTVAGGGEVTATHVAGHFGVDRETVATAVDKAGKGAEAELARAGEKRTDEALAGPEAEAKAAGGEVGEAWSEFKAALKDASGPDVGAVSGFAFLHDQSASALSLEGAALAGLVYFGSKGVKSVRLLKATWNLFDKTVLRTVRFALGGFRDGLALFDKLFGKASRWMTNATQMESLLGAGQDLVRKAVDAIYTGMRKAAEWISDKSLSSSSDVVELAAKGAHKILHMLTLPPADLDAMVAGRNKAKSEGLARASDVHRRINAFTNGEKDKIDALRAARLADQRPTDPTMADAYDAWKEGLAHAGRVVVEKGLLPAARLLAIYDPRRANGEGSGKTMADLKKAIREGDAKLAEQIGEEAVSAEVAGVRGASRRQTTVIRQRLMDAGLRVERENMGPLKSRTAEEADWSRFIEDPAIAVPLTIASELTLAAHKDFFDKVAAEKSLVAGTEEDAVKQFGVGGYREVDAKRFTGPLTESLAGKFVTHHLFEHLKIADTYRHDYVEAALRFFNMAKRAIVTSKPSAWLRQTFSQGFGMGMAGSHGTWTDHNRKDADKEIDTEGPAFTALRDAGQVGNEFVPFKMADEMDTRDAIRAFVTGSDRNLFYKAVRAVENVVFRGPLGTAARAIETEYSRDDLRAKIIMYKDFMAREDIADPAARHKDAIERIRSVFDYGQIIPLFRDASLVWPFQSYNVKMAETFLRYGIKENPAYAILGAALPFATVQLMLSMMTGETDEDTKRKHEMSGGGLFGPVKRLMMWPIGRDQQGRMSYLDWSTLHPLDGPMRWIGASQSPYPGLSGFNTPLTDAGKLVLDLASATEGVVRGEKVFDKPADLGDWLKNAGYLGLWSIQQAAPFVTGLPLAAEGIRQFGPGGELAARKRAERDVTSALMPAPMVDTDRMTGIYKAQTGATMDALKDLKDARKEKLAAMRDAMTNAPEDQRLAILQATNRDLIASGEGPLSKVESTSAIVGARLTSPVARSLLTAAGDVQMLALEPILARGNLSRADAQQILTVLRAKGDAVKTAIREYALLKGVSQAEAADAVRAILGKLQAVAR